MNGELLQSSEMSSLMDQKQVAKMLGVSTKTLESWRWRKTGPRFIKIGRLARYRMSDVMAYIQGLIDKEVVKQG